MSASIAICSLTEGQGRRISPFGAVAPYAISLRFTPSLTVTIAKAWLMEERRKHSRTVIKERAYVSSGGSVMTCWVRNISPEGAAIEVESPAFVPPSFRLVMASGSSVHECRIAWLQKNRIGVTFTGKSEPTVFKQIQLKPSERRTPYLQNLCPEMHRSHVTGDGGYMVESTDDIDTREARVLLFHGREDTFPVHPKGDQLADVGNAGYIRDQLVHDRQNRNSWIDRGPRDHHQGRMVLSA